MEQQFTAWPTREELLIRLTEALTCNGELNALVAFLRDELAFSPDNRSIVGPVLRQNEFDSWRALMLGVQWDADWPIICDAGEVRTLSRTLLTEMERS